MPIIRNYPSQIDNKYTHALMIQALCFSILFVYLTFHNVFLYDFENI